MIEISSDQVVVWNPWAERAKTLDMPPNGYRNMLCIEAANIEPVLSIAPGTTHTLATRIRGR